MPGGIHSKMICTDKKTTEFVPTEHQKEALKTFVQNKEKTKGMLLYHELGSGKTCTAILIADYMLNKKLIKHVYILTPGSLRTVWLKEYCKLCGNNSDVLKNNYTFITYNYAVSKLFPKKDELKDTLVIIDEAHKFINGVKNKSITNVEIYKILSNSNCRILALTGTPVFSYVYEFGLLAKLLKPIPEFDWPDILTSTGEIDSHEFMSFFISKEDGTLVPKNKVLFKQRLKGIISYYPGGKDIPKIIEEPPILVRMSIIQERNYWVQDNLEKNAFPPEPGLSKRNPAEYNLQRSIYVRAKKNILTRKASNMLLIPEINKPDLPEKSGGWINHENVQKYLKQLSPKLVALLLNIVIHFKQKHVVYTFFKTKGGANMIKNILTLCDIKADIFSGDTSDSQKKEIISRFNSKNNTHGEKLRVLVITGAGEEGITLLDCNNMHIFESSPVGTTIKQVIGRVVRFKSHMRLPPEERYVKIWRYLSVSSNKEIVVKINKGETINEKIVKGGKTVDEILYEKELISKERLNSFSELLKESSMTSYPGQK